MPLDEQIQKMLDYLNDPQRIEDMLKQLNNSAWLDEALEQLDAAQEKALTDLMEMNKQWQDYIATLR